MEDIKVGEYVRTSKGEITRIIGLDDFIEDDGTTFYETTDNPGYMDLCSKDIVKHSQNIIDLIEIGDYVNGHRVVDTDNNNVGIMREVYCEDDEDFGIWDEMIETIVTKEQFANIEYKLNT